MWRIRCLRTDARPTLTTLESISGALVTRIADDAEQSFEEIGARWEFLKGAIGLSVYHYGVDGRTYGDSELYSRSEFDSLVSEYGLVFEDADAVAAAVEAVWPPA